MNMHHKKNIEILSYTKDIIIITEFAILAKIHNFINQKES